MKPISKTKHINDQLADSTQKETADFKAHMFGFMSNADIINEAIRRGYRGTLVKVAPGLNVETMGEGITVFRVSIDDAGATDAI